MSKVLVTGAFGQVGSDLLKALIIKHGKDSVIATDISDPPSVFGELHSEKLDVRKPEMLKKILLEEDVKKIYHLASILSASGEKNPFLAFDVNIKGTYDLLRVCSEIEGISVMIPSSIAVYGTDSPKNNVSTKAPTRPGTMYGISKVTGELLGMYFYKKFGLDVRGLRFPGLISYETQPTAGTTDYSVDMFIHAVKGLKYSCYLRADTMLPMMYMPDAIKSMINLSEADPSRLIRRIDYNVSAFSFTPSQLYSAIRKIIPGFTMDYKVDSRQEIADSWPASLDVSDAVQEWDFRPEYSMESMVADMIMNLRKD